MIFNYYQFKRREPLFYYPPPPPRNFGFMVEIEDATMHKVDWVKEGF